MSAAVYGTGEDHDCRLRAAAVRARPLPFIFALAGAALHVEAARADWTVDAAGTATVIATDNVGLQPKGKGAIEPGVGANLSVRGSGERGSLAFDGQSLFLGQIGGGQPKLRPIGTFYGTGTGVLVPDYLFVDGQASSFREIAASNAAFSQNPGAGLGEQTDFTTLSVSPYLRHHFDWGDAELRYRHQRLFTTAGGGDVSRNEETALLSREIGEHVKASLDLRNDDIQVTGNEGLGSLRRAYGRAAIEGEIVRAFSLTATGGWERDVVKTDGTIERPVWNAGFIARPGSRTQIEVAAGQRYGRANVYASARYQVAADATAGFRHTETLLSQNEDVLEADVARGVDAQGRIIDVRTGVPVSFGEALLGAPGAPRSRRGISNPGVFILRSNDAWFSVPGAATTVTAAVYYDQLSPLTPTSNSEVDYGVHGRVDYAFSPLTRAYFDVIYNRSRVNGVAAAQTVTEEIGLQRNLSDRLTARIAYARADQFAGPAAGRFRENAVMVFLTRTF
jgi:uncharacterized protein (PEP-CTERM system associated)